jgi:1,4-dihydroxy-2-naphthoate polyprenyltransferase
MSATRPLPRLALDFARLSRPHFLSAGVGLFGLGLAIVHYEGRAVSSPLWLWGQLAVTAIQASTAYVNDYFDLAADRQNPSRTFWSGGSGVLVRGALPPSAALLLGAATSVLAVACLLVLRFALSAPPLPLAIAAVALAVAWVYSAPPFRLHSRGVGEVTGAVVVSGMTPLFAYSLHTGSISTLALLLVVPTAAAGLIMLLGAALPDLGGDLAAGKRTLVVRLGYRAAANLYLGVVVAICLWLPVSAVLGVPPLAAIGAAMGLPLAPWLVWRLRRGPLAIASRFGWWTFGGAMFLFLTTMGELGALIALA